MGRAAHPRVVRLDDEATNEEGAMRDETADAPEDDAAEPSTDLGVHASEAGAEAADAENAAETTPPPFVVAARTRLEDAEALLAHLRASGADEPPVIDASAVEALTTPVVLALVAAARERAEAGGSLAVERPSPAFVDAFSDLGLFHDLMKMEFRT